MFKYNIDEIIYIPNKRVMIKGWCIGADALKLRIDEESHEFLKTIKRTDVLEKYKELVDNDLLGFDINVNVRNSIDKIDLCAYSEGKKIENLLIYDNKELEKFMCTESILYNIDSVEYTDDNVIIKGWVFSKYYNRANIQVSGVSDYEINRQERLDVTKAYNDYLTTDKCGFEIICKNHKISKKVTLELADDCSKTDIIINKKYISKKDNDILRYVYRNFTINNIKKGLLYLKNYGYKAVIEKIKNNNLNKEVLYSKWLNHNMPTEEQLENQRLHKFDYEPLVSIVVPTYNTPETFLREMIDSVINQTYKNWELCIADGSDDKTTIKILQEYAKNNERVKVKYLETNEGISGNTNRALELVEGDYIGLFDHDDLLTPDALHEVVKSINENNKPDFIYTDEDKVDERGTEFFDPHFKPDWSPDTLRSYNYITHFSVFKKSLLNKIGQFRSEFDGSQDYDLILRLTEASNQIVHIHKVLYHWRVHKNSTASGGDAKPYTYKAAQNAINEHLKRININGCVEEGIAEGTHRVKYKIEGNPLVSIIIPNKDHKDDLEKCINSIFEKSTYNNYEIIIVENNSESKEIFEYYEELKSYINIRTIIWKDEFNYSAINNFGVKESKGEYLVLLNNDIEIISEDWIQEMLMFSQRKDVGIVGSKLYYPDDTIQHAGVILGIGGVAGHSHKYFNRMDGGYFSRTKIVQNLSAVTAACLMIRKDVFDEVEGLDEKFKVAFNDVDLCMKVREKEHLVVFTPYAEMYHHESKSRGSEDTEEKKKRFEGEVNRFREKWGLFLYDPYYNKNLTLEKEDFTIKIS